MRRHVSCFDWSRESFSLARTYRTQRASSKSRFFNLRIPKYPVTIAGRSLHPRIRPPWPRLRAKQLTMRTRVNPFLPARRLWRWAGRNGRRTLAIRVSIIKLIHQHFDAPRGTVAFALPLPEAFSPLPTLELNRHRQHKLARQPVTLFYLPTPLGSGPSVFRRQ